MPQNRKGPAILELIKQSAARISDEYFLIPVANGQRVLRERIYCYELYHQMRLRLGRHRLVLHAESDKTGHPIIEPMMGRVKPDFILHVPGSMTRNDMVMEVKQATCYSKLKDDIGKLGDFIHLARYRFGILLVFGNSRNCERDLLRLRRQAKNDGIVILWHRAARNMPLQIALRDKAAPRR